MIGTGTFLQQRYRIDKQIGQGGMGAVYVATDERFGSTVAIKETLTMDDNFRKAIEREARLLNSLKHVALPRVSDHFEEENSQFLVMEYVAGEDLSTIIERDNKPFEVDTVLDWADQLLDALNFLHTQEMPVVHRDIKPQNLKLTPQGRIVLLDFGLAKGNPTDASHNTAAKSIFGYSRNYASLEQIQGTGTDPRSDLYSLAATLYHLMTGVPPDDALTRAMSVVSQQADPLVPASNVRSEIPRGVAGVLQMALDLNAAARPSSAAEMRQMLVDPTRYEDRADTNLSAKAASNERIFAEKTRLMPETTRAAGLMNTDVKTEVLPSYISEQTSVRSTDSHAGPNTTNSPVALAAIPRRPARKIATVIASLLLVLGVTAGGLYMAKPELFGTTSPVAGNANIAPEPQAVQSVSAPNANAQPEESSIDPPMVPEGSAAPSTSGKSKTSSKVAEPQTAGKGQNSDRTTTVMGDDNEKMTVVERPNETIITSRDEDGKVTRVRLPSSGRKPFPNIGPIFPEGFDPSKLTPQQRRQLKSAVRNGQIPPPKPKPAETPDDNL